MPGEDVKIGLGTNKDHLEGKGEFVGNQLPNIETDFTFDDSDDVINKEVEKTVEEIEEITEEVEENTEESTEETAECGGCGADIPIDAKSCQICGAKFE